MTGDHAPVDADAADGPDEAGRGANAMAARPFHRRTPWRHGEGNS